MLTDEEIAEFQRLYLEHYGIALSTEHAVEYGTQLIRLIQAVIGHTPKMNA